MIDNATDISAEHLEDLLNEECKCEKKYHDLYECTHLAVAKLSFKCDTFNPLVCQSIVTEYWEACENEDWCEGCGNLVSGCWSIRPV